ncbi:FUSC family protein [Rhizobium calliandrae]|uniref:FUSC family protein n=1 Tax=Rhizobium calliandrae TaxID=1312182 RepID=A0ABT7KPP0_9HYPH|nr:FUSC family protein [Rhizobium calliandrae]MDL2410595.1 FUSC family protein [Rhizobium calliandrae]
MGTLAYRLSRRLELYPFAATPEQIGVLEGLRAATAVAAMVLIAYWLQWPRFSWAAFGAFWVCLADPGGPTRLRFSAMAGFAAAGTIAAFISSVAAGISPVVAGAALLPLVFIASLSGTYGAAAAQSGMLICVVAVVAVEFPGSPATGLELAAIFGLGCVWALVLCIGIWRIHPHAPARRAIISVFARLDDMTADLLVLDQRSIATSVDWKTFNAEHRRSVRAAIERARSLVNGLENGSDRYRQEIELADRIFASLIAAGHCAEDRSRPLDEKTERRLLHQLLLLQTEARDQAAHRASKTALLSKKAVAVQHKAHDIDSVIGRAAYVAAKALEDLAALWSNGSAPAIAESGSPGRGAAARLIRPIPANVLRHAARTSIGVVTAYAITIRLDLSFSYWATMATVVVLQPFAATTWPRTVERMAGSVAGGFLAAALMAILTTKLVLLAVIFPVAAATIAFRFVNYTLFVLFLTPLFVLVTELLQPGTGIASARAINNIIGSLVALGASFLFRPAQQGQKIGDVLADAVTANLAFAAAVIASGGAPSTLEGLRQRAGVTSNAAEALRHRMILEGRRRRARLSEMADLLQALRALAGAATAMSLTARNPDETRAADLGVLAETLSNRLRQSHTGIPVTETAGEPRDEIDRALHAVTGAATAYMNVFPPANLVRDEERRTMVATERGRASY